MPMTSFGPDGIWQHVVFRDIPPLEILKIRRMQKIRLARYARIDYFVWDARDVLDLATCYAELVEVLNAEQDMSKASESQ